ncbi:tropomyosin-like [Montipora foliosa]|uniref:tropomyosin-like n=1 Tax=Montipora foliosa TaxID=591990 RepID=UPI0035F10829
MSNVMDSLIKKMQAVKTNTDVALEREYKAKVELKALNEDIFCKENERAACERRLQLLRLRLKDVTAEIEEKEKTLTEVSEKAEIEGQKGKDLSYAEVETDEQLRSIEAKVQEAQSTAESSQMKLNDAQRKLTVLENEVSRAEKRLDTAFRRIPELEQIIKTAGESLRKLEQGDVLAGEKESDFEQKVKILGENITAKIKECEEFERTEGKNLRRINDIMNDIENYQEKKCRLQDEFAAIGELE